MGDTGHRRTRTLFTALLPGKRGVLEAVKRKIIGRLLLDGGTVEEPARGRELELPGPERRGSLRPGRPPRR